MSGQQKPQYPSYRRQGYNQPGPSVPNQSYSSQATPRAVNTHAPQPGTALPSPSYGQQPFGTPWQNLPPQTYARQSSVDQSFQYGQQSTYAMPAPSRSNTSSSTSARTPRNWAQAFVPVYRMTATIIHGWLAKRFPTEFAQYDLKAFAVEPFNDVFRFRVPKVLSQEEVDSIIDLREKDEED